MPIPSEFSYHMFHPIRRVLRISKPFPRVYFDLKAFRKGISEKKESLIEAEKREIDRVYAKPAPDGWTIEKFLSESKLAEASDSRMSPDEIKNFYKEIASCFDDWNDFISSSKKDLYRVSNTLNSAQVKKLWHHIDLFNHGLFPSKSGNTSSVLGGKRPARQGAAWTDEEDEKLVLIATEKYDYTFGDCWIYIADELERTTDEVEGRFTEIFLKKKILKNFSEILISKSFRPLLMNRQFRIVPPQCYIVPSEENFPSPPVNASDTIPDAFKPYMLGEK